MRNSEQQIRAALFCDSLPPVLDGVSRVLQNYANELQARGTPCCVVGPSIKGAAEAFPCDTLLLPAVRPKFTDPYPITLPFGPRYVAKRLKPFAPTIIHAHSPFSLGYAAHKIAKRNNIPSVATLHSRYRHDFIDRTKSKIYTHFTIQNIARCFSHFTEVWALNPGVAEELASYGYKGKVTIVGNATELAVPEPTELARLREKGRALMQIQDPATFIFLFVGQHRKGKGVFTIIEALNQVKQELARSNASKTSHESVTPQKPPQPWHMVFVGDGPDRAEMQQAITACNLSENITFFGTEQNREKIKQLYAGADLFLFPSYYDCDPIVPREAAAMGTPSLLLKDSYATSSNLYHHNHNAFLIENSPKALSKEIQRVMHNQELLAQTSAKALEEIPKTWATAIDEVEDHYLRIIKEFHRP